MIRHRKCKKKKPAEPLPPKVYVNGRRAILQAMDCMLGEERNINHFVKRFQKLWDRRPIRTFTKIVMPLLPKQQEIEVHETSAKEVARQLKLMNDLVSEKDDDE